MKKKILFFDIDGTVINSFERQSEVPLNFLRALDVLRRECYIVCSTGRSKSMLPESIMALNFDGFITSDGATVEFMDKILFEKYISPHNLLQIYFALHGINKDFNFETNELIYVNEVSEQSAALTSSAYDVAIDKFLAINVEHLPKYKVNKLVIKDRLNDATKERYSKIMFDNLEMVKYEIEECIGCRFSDVDKVDGIKKILAYTKLRPENAYVFGDGSNDVKSFEYLENNCAMGNASEKLINVANHVSDDIRNDGLFKALIKVGLIKYPA